MDNGLVVGVIDARPGWSIRVEVPNVFHEWITDSLCIERRRDER